MHPHEFIRGLLGSKVSIILRNKEEYRGILKMYDDHINLVLSQIEKSPGSIPEVLVLRSDSILTISEA
ncbi:hypothetical protein NEOKW01_1321 [Nematocida sp. AWRm80]|nr:hypothetical protein NEOKW01_1321 [Nematocida sp. AWRm80]